MRRRDPDCMCIGDERETNKVRFHDRFGVPFADLRQETFDWLDLLEPHRVCTAQRMAAQPVVLCLQDTTELDFNGQQIEGLGPLNYEAQRGMYLHPTLAVSPAREPLGVLDAWMWARAPKAADGTRGGEKESTRWVEGYTRVAELAEQLEEDAAAASTLITLVLIPVVYSLFHRVQQNTPR